jgi:hypothetical protein
VGIGTNAPAANLDVAAGTTAVNTVINGTGTINDFLQYNIQNLSTGANAQSGYSATADNGSNTTGFAWIGINNSNFNYPTTYNIGVGNDVSLLGSGQDLYIANANNTKSIIFSTGKSTTPYFNERMRITNAGDVGIGTNAPAYPLDVQTVLSTSISGYGYLNASGTAGYIAGSSGTTNFSARFSGRIICPEFNAQSDIRIKEIIGRSNSENDLEVLNKIQITDYEMKDKVIWGHKKFKKVIAQEVEAVYPLVVSQSVGFVPDIYQNAVLTETAGGYLIRFDSPVHIKNDAKKIRLITVSGNADMDLIAIQDDKTLFLKGDKLDAKANVKVFVYGEEVADFRVVDYEGLSTLNISATQELYKLIKKQQEEIENLKTENVQLRNNLSNEVQTIKAELDTLSKNAAKD